MVFPEIVTDWGSAVLKHDSSSNKSFIYSINRILGRRNVDAKTINKVASEYKLVFCNHFVETSHFVNFINKSDFAKDFRSDFFSYLLLYFKQFYPDYELTSDINDEESLSVLFDNCYEKIYLMLGEFLDGLDDNDLSCIKRNTESINEIFGFYDKIEDFMIRFYGYSIVGISNQKHIITACSDCDKRFIDELLQGYSLFRLQRLVLVKDGKSQSMPHYEFSMVLPTKDVGFPIDEYIEIPGNDNRIESRRMAKLLR